MKNKIAFLFGAGISESAKIPPTKCITEKIFSGKGIVRGAAENYSFADPKTFNWDPNQEYIPRIITFLQTLEKEFKDTNEYVNYEDLYYLLDFIRKNIYGAEKNPAFKYLLKNFESTIEKLSSPIDPLINSEVTLENLLDETIKYIEYTVINSLSKKPENFNGLALLSKIIDEPNFTKIDIFTLNHDTVIEKFFLSYKQPFCEGFGDKANGYRFWDQSLFGASERINLFKLHGSIDWYYFDETSWTDLRVCKCTSEIIYHNPRKPIILIGTYNKLAEYIKSIYLELFCLFYKTLKDHNKIIISGYSFGDRGINDKIFDWLLTGNNRMIIIDPYVENLKDRMPYILHQEWDAKNKIVPIKEYIENVTLKKLEQYL